MPQGWSKAGNLRGPAGAKGDTGAAGAKGDTGATGAKGDTGAAGQRGTGWFSAALAVAGTVPDQTNTIVGDFLLDTNTGDYYLRTS